MKVYKYNIKEKSHRKTDGFYKYWVNDPTPTKTVKVVAGQTAKVNAEDNLYCIKWATGDYWYGKEHLFGDDAVYKSLGNITFTTTRSGNWIHYQYLELDLADTSISSSTIKPEAF